MQLPEFRPLLYVVTYESEDEPDDSYSPIVAEPQLEAVGATLPHLLSSEMKTAVDALWYCLHLPKGPQDFLDLPVSHLDEGRRMPTGHNILLMPINFVSEALSGSAAEWPRTLLIGPDSQRKRMTQLSERLSFTIPPLLFSELSGESLRDRWSALKDAVGLGGVPSPAVDLAMTALGATSPTVLPLMRLLRQLGINDAPPATGEEVKVALFAYQVQTSLAELEAEGIPQNELPKHMPQTMARVGPRLRLPVVLGLPGQSSRHFNRYGVTATGNESIAGSTSELPSIALMVTKDALARDSWGAVLKPCPSSAFSALAQLEDHCLHGARPSGVARIRARLNDAMADIWSEDLTEMVMRASHIEVLSDFPLGLVTPPNATDPLNMMVPISTRALTPLSRTLPSSLAPAPIASMPRAFKVLVCECIRPDDRVGQASRAGWEAIKRIQSPLYPGDVFEVTECLTEGALRTAVADYEPDILIVSAHGFSEPDDNVAGIMIGDTPSLGIGLGPLPPLVIVSSCHVDPRGTGAVTIADLLFREGALAVLATLIPVHVMRNITLVNRFLLYLRETMAGAEEYSHVGEVWHWVQRSNAVHDITSGNSRFEQWFMRRKHGRPSPHDVFKSSEWSRRLRRGHFYEDSEKLLIAIAEKQGDEHLVSSWIRSGGYVPETMFYSMLGRPENIVLEGQKPSHG